MEDMVKLIADNGISVVCVCFMIYYILVSQKETNKTLQEVSKTLTAIVTVLGLKEEDIEHTKRNIGG